MQRPGGLLGLFALHRVPDGTAQRLAVHLSLEQVVLGTRGDRIGGNLQVGQPGKHQHRGPRRAGQDLPQRLQAVAVGQVQVQQHAVRAVLQGGQRRLQRPHPAQPHGEFAVEQELLDQQRVAVVVLHQEHVDGGFGDQRRGYLGLLGEPVHIRTVRPVDHCPTTIESQPRIWRFTGQRRPASRGRDAADPNVTRRSVTRRTVAGPGGYAQPARGAEAKDMSIQT